MEMAISRTERHPEMTALATIETPIQLAPVELTLADQHPAAVYVARLGERSKRVMRRSLDLIADLLSGGKVNAEGLAWASLRYQHTAAVRAGLIERYAPATANRHLAALRGVLKEAWRLGQMSAEDYHRAVYLSPVRGETLPAGREVNQGELRALFQVCEGDHTPAGARDAALMSALYGGGLRRSEAVAIDLADYNRETGELRVLHAKGSKQRLVYATNGGRAAIEAWLEARGDEPGPLLCPVNKGGRISIRRMTDQAVLKVLRKRAAQAGVSRFSPHDLRRSFISHLLDAGADISTVQRLAGHSSPSTTSRYDRRGEVAKRKASGLLHVPYQRRSLAS